METIRILSSGSSLECMYTLNFKSIQVYSYLLYFDLVGGIATNTAGVRLVVLVDLVLRSSCTQQNAISESSTVSSLQNTISGILLSFQL